MTTLAGGYVAAGPTSAFWLRLISMFLFAAQSYSAVNKIEWGVVPESVLKDQAFDSSFVLRDSAGNPVAPADGYVRIKASIFPANPERTVLQGVPHNYVNNGGRFDLGWSFTPKRDLRVTHLRSYMGVKIRLLTEAGKILAEEELPHEVGRWFEVRLRQAVALKAGVKYQIQTDTGGKDYFAYRLPWGEAPIAPEDLNIHYAFENNDLWLVDLKYTPMQSAPGATPDLVENLSTGNWAGNFSVDSVGGYVFLEAEAEGVVGFSRVFQVTPENNLRLTQTLSSTNCTLGDPLVYTWRAQHSGPGLMGNVVVSASIPDGATLIQVTSSKGAHRREDDQLLFDIGELAAGEEAVLKMVLVPQSAGIYQQEAEVTAANPDSLPADDKVTSTVQVFERPLLGVSDLIVFVRPENGVTTNAVFEVTLTAPSSRSVFVDYSTISATALEGEDYQTQTGSLLFAPGVLKQQVTVPISAAHANEPNEKFQLKLSHPVNASLDRELATCQIINPANRPTVTVADVRVAEGDAEYGVEALFTFKLSHPMPLWILMDISTSAGTATAMTWPSEPGEADFYESWGGAGIEPGRLEGTVGVPIQGDDFPEANETFRLWYSTEMANTTRTFATATIVNDDPTPAVTVGNAFVREDSVGNTTLVFPVELSKASATVATFSYQTASGTASLGADFEGKEGVLMIAAGERGANIEVTVLPDSVKEETEDLVLQLSAPSGCILMKNAANGTIADAFNKLPVINFASPVYGATNNVGDSVTVQFEATDPDGEVAKVALTINGALRREQSGSVLSFDWVPTSPGRYVLAGRAWDDKGAATYSAEWEVRVLSAQSLEFVSPAHDSVSPQNEPLIVRVRYTGAVTLEKLELWSGHTLAGTFAPGSLEFIWTNPPAGQHFLTVKAVDINGGVHTADSIVLTITAPRPENDMFAASSTLAGFSPQATGTTLGATVESGEPIHGNPSARASVWWNWTAPASGRVTLTATNATGEPLYAVVYLGDIETSLVAKAQFTGMGSFEANAGQRYSIALDGGGNYTGPVSLQLALAHVNLVSPSAQAGYSVPVDVTLRAEVNAPAEVIQKVEFYEGTALIGTTMTSPYQFNWRLETNGYRNIKAVATDYLGGTRASAEVPFVVRPANDHFQNAQPVSGHRVNISTSNTGATLELNRPLFPWFGERRTGEPTYADNQGGHSLWYRWVVPEDGLCRIHGQGQVFSLLLGVYVGNSVSNLAHVAINAMGGWEQPLNFQAAKGTVLNISVDGMFGEEGALNWWLELHPRNDDFNTAFAIREPFYATIASHRGASREAFENTLHPSDSTSVWWTWRAPATAATTVAVSSEEALTQLRIYTGPRANLVTVGSPSGQWSLTASQTFNAVAGQTYSFVVLGQPGETNDFRFQLNQELLRLSNPLDGSAHPAYSDLRLAAVAPANVQDITNVDFLVNDILVGTVTSSPFEFLWVGGLPGRHAITLRAKRADGSELLSLPVTIVLYENNDLPSPSLVLNSRGIEGLVVNSVSSLFVFGNLDHFAAPGVFDKSLPRPGHMPAGVNSWSALYAGNGDVLENSPWDRWPNPDGYHTWSLTPDGVLYRDATNLVEFPTGVTKWTGLYGAGNCLVVGDDGAIYLDGRENLELGLNTIQWKDIAFGYVYMARLSKDGDLYISGRGTFGEPVHQKMEPPAGVRFTEMKSSVYALLLRGTDGQLYQTGDPKPSETVAGGNFKLVPLPPGVTNFTSYALGGFHAMAIGDDGELYTWGRDWEGQLGIGSQSEGTLELKKVDRPPGVTAWTAIAGGYMHSMAIGNDCSLYAWGANDAYQLGLGPLPGQNLPQRVAGMDALCGIPAVYSNGETTRLEDGTFKIRFESALNRPYLIQYSEDMILWNTAYPQVIGNGGAVDWIDDGPPKTSSHPAQVEQRFYRIVFAP